MRSLTALLAAAGLAAVLMASGCAHPRGGASGAWPLLSPASLGLDVSRSQRLSISRVAEGDAASAVANANGSANTSATGPLVLDAVVEVDASALRVAAFLIGQRVLLLSWDGERLQEQREAIVPTALRGASVLHDLQLVYWPADAVRAALPRGWRLEGDDAHRRLYRGERLVFESDRDDVATPLGSARIVNHAAGYRIVIETEGGLAR